MAVPKKICERFAAGMKRLGPIIGQLKDRDVSEADTVTLVKDLLSEVFGFDKYADLTGEYAIRGTFCDLAIKLDGKLTALIEVKAIGISLNDRHVKQAVDYAANQGVEWVILTNGIAWRMYHVLFAKPIDKLLVAEINLPEIDCRAEAGQEALFLISKEGFKKGAPAELKDRQQATSRFIVAALIIENDDILYVIRRELRRVVGILVSEDDVRRVLRAEVIKRDALEGPAAEEAAKRVGKAERAVQKRQPRRAAAPDAGLLPETGEVPQAPPA